MCEKRQTPVPLTRQEYKFILKNGQYLKIPEGTFRYIREQGLRYGIIVSRRTGNAVRRNLIKRRFRTAFMDMLAERSDVWILGIIYHDIKDYGTICSRVAAVLHKIKSSDHEKNCSFSH